MRRMELSRAGREPMPQTEMEATWITYPQAQRITSLGRTTLWRIVKSGEVRSVSIGRAVRIDRRSLENYLERKAQERH
jgi:excisionase family DNA binding protein